MKRNKITTLIFSMLFISFFSFESVAQEPIKHEYTTYVSPTGRFYINKHLPVYLRIATSPDPNAETHLIRSESSPQYSNPFYFDTEGYNTLRTPSQVDTVTKEVIMPKQDIIFEVYTDGLPPKTAISYGSAPTIAANGKLFIGKQMQVVLKATDEVSGVKQIYLSINGEAYKEYNAPVDITAEKEYTFKFYAVDNVGNAEEIVTNKTTATVIADFTGPDTKIELENDFVGTVLSARTNMMFIANDQLSGVAATYYSLDGGPYKKLLAFLKMSTISEGRHTIMYYSEDKLGNKEEVKTLDFFVDKSAPTVSDEVLGSQYVANGRGYSSGRTKFKLTAVDNKAGVKEIYYSLNGAEYTLYTEPFYLPSRTGSAVIRYYAVDEVNNRGGSSAENGRATTTYVDLTGPALSFGYEGRTFTNRDTVFINKNTKIALTAKDLEAGVYKIGYQIDNGSEIDYTDKFTVDTEGVHIITYTGYDNVDNSNRESFFFIVDNAAPEAYSRFSILPIGRKIVDGKELEIYPSHVVLFFPATDARSGYERSSFSVNGGVEKPYTRFVDGFLKNSHYVVKAKFYDKLGNESIMEVEFLTGD